MNRDRYMPDEGRGIFVCRMLMNILLLVTFPVACGIYMKEPPVAMLFSGAEMLIFAIALEVMQKTLKGFAVYSLAHAAALLLIYLGAPYLTLVHVAFAGVATIVMYYGRATRTRDFYPAIGWLVYPVLIYTVGHVGGHPGLRGLGVFAEIMIIALIFVCQNQRGLDRTLTTAKGYVRVPYRKITMVNAIMFGLFSVAAISLSLLLSRIFNGEAIVVMIGRGILSIYAIGMLGLFWLLSHLFPRGGGGAIAAMDSAEIAAILAEYQHDHPYLSILWRFMQIAAILISVAAAGYLLYRFAMNFYRDFRTADLETDDVHLQIVNEEDRNHGKAAGKRVRKPGFFSPSAKMRRMYVKYIRRHPGVDRIKPSYTPTELEQAVTARGDARIRELYERARYAPELTTDEDVREMRQEIKAVSMPVPAGK